MTIGQFLFWVFAAGCVALAVYGLHLMLNFKAVLPADWKSDNVGTENDTEPAGKGTSGEDEPVTWRTSFFDENVAHITCALMVELATHRWLAGEITDKQYADETFAAVSDMWQP